MIKVYAEKLYRYPRPGEHMSVAIPFRQGQLTDTDNVTMWDGDRQLPVQCKITARYGDDSVKYLHLRFMGDLPGNELKEFVCRTEEKRESIKNMAACCTAEEITGGIKVTNGEFWFEVSHDSGSLFSALFDGNSLYDADRFEGPYLETDAHTFLPWEMRFHTWETVENGPLCVILKTRGEHRSQDKKIQFEAKLTAWAGKPWVEVSYRLINTSADPLRVEALGFYCKASNDTDVTSILPGSSGEQMIKSVTENQDSRRVIGERSNTYRAKGTGILPQIERAAPVDKIRTCTGYSNYKTDFTIGSEGQYVCETVTADRLVYEANEHFSEVLYGTFFGDRTDDKGGICATIYQAQQNYPKAVAADKDGLWVMLVPRGIEEIVFQPGVSREQRFLLHFHDPSEGLAQLDNRSLIYQMPDRPVLHPDVFREAGVFPDIFPEKMDADVEIMLIRKADGHNRAYGMLNWGDSMDANYTSQGRGGGAPVWVNNEYDFPHACAMMYVRTGTRRFMDYMLAGVSHWMDVDVCHYSQDPDRIGGQIEHTKGHVIDGKIVPSHEWVEGLLDYYHFTGDKRAFDTALGIGENVLRLLDSPEFSTPGEMNARETGWALRSLTALYLETREERWLSRSEWIIGSFRAWEEEYGYWLSPYTDNTLIRVGFMISVAIGSLMRHYRVFPDESLKALILRAVDDLTVQGALSNGLFYYKELPSLNRLGGNTLLLEAMAAGYELTGDRKYLEAGWKTFENTVKETGSSVGGGRTHTGDAVIWAGESTKTFAQSFLPLAVFYNALVKAGMR